MNKDSKDPGPGKSKSKDLESVEPNLTQIFKDMRSLMMDNSNKYCVHELIPNISK